MSMVNIQNKSMTTSGGAVFPFDAQPPFSSEIITLAKNEYIQLRWEAQYWKRQHARSSEREQVLKAETERLHGRIRDLTQRLYGRKTEKGTNKSEGSKSKDPKRSRGQQEKSKGHGRTLLGNLPVKEEFVDLAEEEKYCPCCGLPLEEFPFTQDSEVLEYEVRGYRRHYRRKSYKPTCHCNTLPGFITAPAPNRLIPKGKLGISLWVEILINKFLYCQPTNRLLQSLANIDMPLSQGTVTGGLVRLKGLFDPLLEAIKEKILNENYWHVDETTWKVFQTIEGKSGYGWYLWVVRSESAVVYLLDPSRSSKVPKGFFGEKARGTIICDRYSAYKKLVREVLTLVLAFCWAHVRRDFLEAGRKYPKLERWGADWVERIGWLYHLNHQRLEVVGQTDEFASRDGALRGHLAEIEYMRDRELADGRLHQKAHKVLQSLKNHWAGLIRFVDHPHIRMDNNWAENAARTPACGRKAFYGSGRKWSGQFAATMYSILMTVNYSGLNPRLWLAAYLQACAEEGNRAPHDLQNFLPWSMDQKRLGEFAKQGAVSAAPP
jgi:transposase